MINGRFSYWLEAFHLFNVYPMRSVYTQSAEYYYYYGIKGFS
jgi:hypothetical protein